MSKIRRLWNFAKQNPNLILSPLWIVFCSIVLGGIWAVLFAAFWGAIGAMSFIEYQDRKEVERMREEIKEHEAEVEAELKKLEADRKRGMLV